MPWKTNGSLGQVGCSLHLLISLNVSKSTRSEGPFYFPVIFSLLYVYEMLERPILGLFSIKNVLKLHAHLHCRPTAVHKFQQNVERASMFLSETCLHKLSITNVVILHKIVRCSKDLGIADYLPTAREFCNGWHGPAQ